MPRCAAPCAARCARSGSRFALLGDVRCVRCACVSRRGADFTRISDCIALHLQPLQTLAVETDKEELTAAVASIFSNLKQLQSFHVILQAAFDTCKTPADFAATFVKFSDFFKIGAPLNALLAVVAIFLIPIIWPFFAG